jgi:hypothetical protein
MAVFLVAPDVIVSTMDTFIQFEEENSKEELEMFQNILLLVLTAMCVTVLYGCYLAYVDLCLSHDETHVLYIAQRWISRGRDSVGIWLSTVLNLSGRQRTGAFSFDDQDSEWEVNWSWETLPQYTRVNTPVESPLTPSPVYSNMIPRLPLSDGEDGAIGPALTGVELLRAQGVLPAAKVRG